MNSEVKRSPVKIRIQSFQSIEDLELVVDGFMCITGPTNIGKSAIVRAIRRSILNKPVTGMVRRGDKFCTVSIRSNEWGFTWQKGEKGVNRYEIDGKKDPLDKVGQTQVEDVRNMGFGSISVGDKDLYPWHASQFDSLFLLNESGPAITGFLSSMCNLDRLQDAATIASKSKRKSLDEAKLRDESSVRARAKEAKLSDLDKLQILESEIEAQTVSISEYEVKIQTGLRYQSEIDECQRVIQTLESAHGVKIPKDVVSEGVQQLADMNKHHNALMTAAGEIIKLQPVKDMKNPEFPTAELEKQQKLGRLAAIPTLKSTVSKLEKIKNVDPPSFAEVAALQEKCARGESIFGRLQTAQKAISKIEKTIPAVESIEVPPSLIRAEAISKQIKVLDSEIESMTIESQDLASELEILQRELAKIPMCPTCDRPMQVNQHAHPG